MTDDEYMLTAEKNYRKIKAFEKLFTPESYKAFNKTHKTGTRADYENCMNAISLLKPVGNIEERVWYLWDYENMPVPDGEEITSEDFINESQLDYEGFVPFIITFLQDDPAEAKGNIILVSGGGFHFRSNSGEAYKTYPIFLDLGYNVFILQRRIAPYSGKNSFMDLQRAIRLVRYHAEQENWGGQDMIAAVGWSGGGGTLMGAVGFCYGALTPAEEYDSDYIPDEIDMINSDLDVAIPVYGVFPSDSEELKNEPDLGTGPQIVDNPNIPAFYICQGLADEIVDPSGATELYDILM
ncbi:MAG: hypothetical protein HUJ76_12815, partial [Parasporobacterium sp.]|nr:hypothetical protein [Parasporobacterium sp.]